MYPAAFSNSGRVAAFGISRSNHWIDFRLIGHVPAREEGGERKLGEHHEVDALRVRLIEQIAEPLHDGLAGLGFLDGTGLGSSNADNAGHQEAILRSSRLISLTTGHNITR